MQRVVTRICGCFPIWVVAALLALACLGVAAQTGRSPSKERVLRGILVLPPEAEINKAKRVVMKSFRVWSTGRVGEFRDMLAQQSALRRVKPGDPGLRRRAMRVWRKHAGTNARLVASVRLQVVHQCTRGQAITYLGVALTPAAGAAYQSHPASLDRRLAFFTYRVRGEVYTCAVLKAADGWRLLNQPLDVRATELPVGDAVKPPKRGHSVGR